MDLDPVLKLCGKKTEKIENVVNVIHMIWYDG